MPNRSVLRDDPFGSSNLCRPDIIGDRVDMSDLLLAGQHDRLRIPCYIARPPVLERSYRSLDTYLAGLHDIPGQPSLKRVTLSSRTRLPAAIRGQLRDDDPWDGDDDHDASAGRAGGVARRWLMDGVKSQALLGVTDGADLDSRLGTAHVTLATAGRSADPAAGDAARLAHVRFQQRHGGRPVFGGQLIVHLASGDRRVSVSSSYYPIDDGDPVLEAPADETHARENAIEAARLAVAAWVSGRDAAGLFWELLRPHVRDRSAGWSKTDAALARSLIGAVQGQPGLPRAWSVKPPTLPGAGDRPVLPDFSPTREDVEPYLAWLDSLRLPQWTAQLAPYEGSELAVLPFRGDYYLAYCVEVLSPDMSRAWRVWVDAQSGKVLGPPHRLGLAAHYYRTAADVLADVQAAGSPTMWQTETLPGNPAQSFMKVTLYDPDGQPDQDPPVVWGALGESDRDVETASVAKHAQELYTYFVDTCRIPEKSLQEYKDWAGNLVSCGLQARIGKSDTTELQLVFNHAQSVNPKLLTFQSGCFEQEGSEGGGQVYNPAWDPEFVYHEVAHGLMWLWNSKPFEDLCESMPFGYALVEGAAIYLARSFADTRGDSGSALWARAAYPVGDWSNQWALERQSDPVVGADLLPAPNLYPRFSSQDLSAYQVGMIWARALWDVRTLLGAARADRLALQAFQFVPGGNPTFEMAAEGLIDAFEREGIDGIDQAALPLFARRGILAGQGVQALVHSSQHKVLVAGGDACVMRSSDYGVTWELWGRMADSRQLKDVVALASDGSDFYAAVAAAGREGDLWTGSITARTPTTRGRAWAAGRRARFPALWRSWTERSTPAQATACGPTLETPPPGPSCAAPV